MYVCLWLGYPKKDYLVSIQPSTKDQLGKANWTGNLQEARRFETRAEAEQYLIVRDDHTGEYRRGWEEWLCKVIFIHPLNFGT